MRDVYLIVLRCADIEKTKAFYEHFGMKFEKEKHANGPEHFACQDEVGVFELYPSEGPPDHTGLGLVSDDIEALNLRLKQNRYSPREVRKTDWGRVFVVRDPDGRRIEVAESKPEEGQKDVPAEV